MKDYFTVDDFKDLYVRRHASVVFVGHGPETPQRKDNLIDTLDTIFPSKEAHDQWFKNLQIGLAELDEPMNYCAYFERTKGNEGNYVRDGKSFSVNGQWDGQHLNCLHETPKGFVCCSMKEFSQWLVKNDFKKDWWKLRESYVEWQKNYKPVPFLAPQGI